MVDDPEQLRMRAAQLRTRAEEARFPETKQGLLQIAGDYEVLAQRAEQRIAWWSAQAPSIRPVSSEDRAVSVHETDDQAAQ
jgi:hypothetical protein